jgi:ABC-2 type transport system ATP-binding protein
VAIINRGQIVATNSPENLMAQLVGGSGYELEVDGDATELQKMLQILPGVGLVEIVPVDNLPPNRSLIRITSVAGAETGRDIAAVTIGAGLGIYEMRRTRATLEDVFLELTMQELGNGEEGMENGEDSSQSPSPNPQVPIPTNGGQA